MSRDSTLRALRAFATEPYPTHDSRITNRALVWAAALALLAAASPVRAGEAEWRMLHEQAEAYMQRGNLEQAELYAREALREAEASLGASHRATELSLLRTAYVLRLRGKSDEAMPLAERAVKLSVKLHGDNDPLVGIALQNLGEVESARKNYSAAESSHRKALEIFRNAYGEKHINSAVSMHNIGAMLYAQDRNTEAEKYLRRALAIKVQVLKGSHLSIAHTLDQLSVVLDAQGRQIEAERYRKRAAGIRQRALSPKPSA